MQGPRAQWAVGDQDLGILASSVCWPDASFSPALLCSPASGSTAWPLLTMNKMKNFKRRLSLSVPRTETIEESLTEFTEQFNQLHNRRNEGEGSGCPPHPFGRPLPLWAPPLPCTGPCPFPSPPGTEGLGGQLTPVPLRSAARASQQRPPARDQHLLPDRQRGGPWAAVPWHAVPAAEPAPLLHGGEGLWALPCGCSRTRQPRVPKEGGGLRANFMGSNPSSAVDQLCDLEQVSQPPHTSLVVLKWSS